MKRTTLSIRVSPETKIELEVAAAEAGLELGVALRQLIILCTVPIVNGATWNEIMVKIEKATQQ